MMKYTNYILKGDILNLDQLISSKPVWRQISIVASLPVAFMGLAFFTGAIPMALTADGYRTLKMKYYVYLKKYKRDNYYTEVFSSLSIPAKYRIPYHTILNNENILMNSTISITDISLVPFKLKLQYILSKGTYIITDQQMNTIDTLHKSYSFVRQKVTW